MQLARGNTAVSEASETPWQQSGEQQSSEQQHVGDHS
jgi:hypothetical protein